ncbi:MAG: site-specific integrase [Desulfobacteraceae bacterium]|nr:MAG: site-specific integrase [Desulfobacteraceae bacterium]
MTILAECPFCRKRQSVRNKLCDCGADLDRLKRGQKVKYWISYRLPGGKQRREPVAGENLNPYSIESAREMHSKRVVQKKEKRVFDILPESKMTFTGLSEWYKDLKSVKGLASFNRVRQVLDNFNNVFGDRLVASIKPVDLEDYQTTREEAGAAPATIDMEISVVKTMVNKAFDNDMVPGHALKAFRKVKRKLRKGGNARKRILGFEEYLRLCRESPFHLKALIKVAFNTGMRSGELRGLKWSHVDREKMFIRLPAEMTKEKKPKNIPVNSHVKEVLDSVPHALRHEYVFTYKGQPVVSNVGCKKSFRTACKEAGIAYGRKESDGITFHDIRRTVKTNMLAAGVDKAHRDMILGHSLQGMDVHYLSPTEASLKEAMDRFTRWLDEKLEKASANVDQSVDQEAKPEKR